MKEKEVYKRLLELGFSPRHKGFYYVARIAAELGGEELADARTEYGEVCEKMRGGRKYVEHAIAYAIRFAWEVELGGIRRLFPRSYPPTAMELALALSWEKDREEE